MTRTPLGKLWTGSFEFFSTRLHPVQGGLVEIIHESEIELGFNPFCIDHAPSLIRPALQTKVILKTPLPINTTVLELQRLCWEVREKMRKNQVSLSLSFSTGRLPWPVSLSLHFLPPVFTLPSQQLSYIHSCTRELTCHRQTSPETTALLKVPLIVYTREKSKSKVMLGGVTHS